ncbi:MAG: 5-amino-6-(D-ribitylamino)uracil--L-tyrosine 4-hydroxyphenyl transferase CofH [Gammaproteobacteria bacterium]|nr:5-amino-6-(D-ribitylamino)uracil--L-tyrosine 4-hydroxyphenyl transferase CofH [Gammaproteobacteria bacterium]MCP4090698.1 5-amino-6-(D-ribitylamino)uracil--L-tyrosine 4-hydroxyphenyl transferase CofH [Gammaproteobacteria bacterium]MCP4277125.1 5-amino-6-(D-ribitylamino)uracil--L-tyrosine 4-hydroxyphenyl transferase CofH [Gammaproteobacteria bacterium]MCP4832681.1 5-amino-6-(D-ribitylamino)uracil--L-tyrosine 4-hydroxyphenyl transferase CofH [Gammaproteobacteria bacterium]MCP4928065.1 5-amino-
MTRSGTPQQISTLPLNKLIESAAGLRDQGWGRQVSYSRKVFIPLTELCRDVCHYCTYAKTPKHLKQVYLSPEQVLAIAQAGKAQGCKEALFTLGDKPELRYKAARDALTELGYTSTVDYLQAMAELVLTKTGLLPHLNPGILSLDEYRQLRTVAPSMGIMLESSSERLCQRDMPHFGSPDKQPDVRIEAIANAGKAKVPLTTGILIGIGETRDERLESLLAIEAQHQLYGHIQELIIQNFVPKTDTKMHAMPIPDFNELLWTIATARLIFGPEMSIQAPPNLNKGRLKQLINAGINDWGGVSPITPDHVNPESPWPELKVLTEETATAGYQLTERLTVYPWFIEHRDTWLNRNLIKPVLQHADSSGLARTDEWTAGDRLSNTPASAKHNNQLTHTSLATLTDKASQGELLTENEVIRLFSARGDDFTHVCNAADLLRHKVAGDDITYVVNRNINYTNMCTYRCRFCAFSKGKGHERLRGKPYLLDMGEIARRTEEAWQRGATEVCLQGGIHPSFDGNTYLDICHTVKEAVPDMHVHAFSPLEITHGAKTLNLSLATYLQKLKAAGLGTLPGTAAEILDDSVRTRLCADKINTQQWIEVISTAHEVGLKTTSTIMFGHIETPSNWARHLLTLHSLQERTGGITEFVPLPFVHMEAPMYLRGETRPGPTWREVMLMHAVGRLALHPVIPNIQVSWVKLGRQGAANCLNAGANDLGGTLMNESISRAAGADHGQEMPPEEMDSLINSIGRQSRHRNTLYENVAAEQIDKGYNARELQPIKNRPASELKKQLKNELKKAS